MKRVVIAGLGDTGLLVAMGLARHAEVVGITPKPALVSGQELGMRVARPDDWRKHYLVGFERYRALRGVQVRHGLVERLDVSQRSLTVRSVDDEVETLTYDALVLSPGVTNGFWRTPTLETRTAVDGAIDALAHELASAKSIAVIGGGVTGVSAASNLKEAHGATRVVLAFSQDELLPGYHPRVRASVRARLVAQGVELLPGHRARAPAGFAYDRLTRGAVAFSDGHPPLDVEVALWAVGQTRPNTSFVPPALLDERGFIRVDEHLRVRDTLNVFAVGDAAATDPNRSSARNGGYAIVAHNVRRLLAGQRSGLKAFRPTAHRWGSVLGVQRDGLRVFAPNGFAFRFAPFWVRTVLFPWIVSRGIYRGIDEA
ncbi:MAG: FAD-dependent oxidoreductase [Archangium sp.]|nr:FAD-dependent oxidoreductase [Archangium sp.]